VNHRIRELLDTQDGSRFLQRVIDLLYERVQTSSVKAKEHPTPEEVELDNCLTAIVKEISPIFKDMAVDQVCMCVYIYVKNYFICFVINLKFKFANFVCSKMIMYSSEKNIILLTQNLSQHLSAMFTNKRGNHVIQKLLEYVFVYFLLTTFFFFRRCRSIECTHESVSRIFHDKLNSVISARAREWNLRSPENPDGLETIDELEKWAEGRGLLSTSVDVVVDDKKKDVKKVGAEGGGVSLDPLQNAKRTVEEELFDMLYLLLNGWPPSAMSFIFETIHKYKGVFMMV
jgi:hypothetical protein